MTGLPGLILEARDADNEHIFEFSYIKTVDKPILQLTNNYETVSRDAFRKYRKEKYEADYAKWKRGEVPSPFMNFIDKE